MRSDTQPSLCSSSCFSPQPPAHNRAQPALIRRMPDGSTATAAVTTWRAASSRSAKTAPGHAQLENIVNNSKQPFSGYLLMPNLADHHGLLTRRCLFTQGTLPPLRHRERTVSGREQGPWVNPPLRTALYPGQGRNRGEHLCRRESTSASSTSQLSSVLVITT